LFSLHIGDDTATIDVILAEEDAEFFLNSTVEEFHSSSQRRQAVADRLAELIESNVSMDFYLKSYYTFTPMTADKIHSTTATRKRARIERREAREP
jgi:hypothetical protein